MAPPTRLSVFTLGLASGIALGSLGVASATETSPFANLAVFARALAHIEASHVEPPDQDRLIYGAIRGMVETLDPHSTFLDPDEVARFDADTVGSFAGIGVEIDVRDGWLVVHSVMPGGPAERGGLRAGDRFVALDGRVARDMRLSDAIGIMRGAPGTTVTVRIRREGIEDSIEVALERAIIEVAAVETRVLADDLVVVRIRSFQATTTSELRRALDSAEQHARARHGVRGVLLDLRGNPGGLLHEAVRVSDEFLDSGTIVSTRGRGGEVLSEERAVGPGTRPRFPMVVLVDSYSASAAEIVAAALQQNHRAVIAGMRTWGKGSVQNIIELPDGSALKLTVARYYTPDGTSIQARGVEPDVRIEPMAADDAARLARSTAPISEATLERHLAAEGTGPGAVEPRDEPRRAASGDDIEPFPEDYQARMALQVLRAQVLQVEQAR